MPSDPDIVDNIIWHQLTESRSTSTASTMDNNPRSSPDGMSAAVSPVSIVQPPSVESIPSFPSLSSISPVASARSLSSAANVVSYSPSLSSSCISCEGAPRYVVCVNSYELATPERHCPCQVCSAFDHISVTDDDDTDNEQLLCGSHQHVEPSSSSEAAFRTRPRQLVDISTPSEHDAVASRSHSSEYLTSSQTYSSSRVQPTAGFHRALQGRHPSFPASLPAISTGTNHSYSVV